MRKNNSSKIAIIGAGNVGAAAAYTATLKGLAAEILLIDIDEDKEAGEVMDISDSLCFVETGCVKGKNFKDARDADIIVITAGTKQKKGQSRLDLLAINKKILSSIFKSIGKLRKDAIIIVISNPVDVLTYLIQEITGLPHSQVFGSGTSLDSARLQVQVAGHLDISPQSVHGFVLGEHGDSEFVSWDCMMVGGVPAKKIKGLSAASRKRIETNVKKEAYEIINKKGATFFGIAATLSDIIEAVLLNQKKIIPVTSRLARWNGVSGVCLGAPCVVGRNGVERVWPLTLSSAEKKSLMKSALTIKSYLKQL
ncbi:MAG: L-lactate dehydrogenase [Candidatus Magasanikbacteria bacterium]